MILDDLVRSGQLKKETTSKHDIKEFLQFAEEEIEAARFNSHKFPLTAYKSAYDALLHAGNALIRYHGYRPTAKYTHITITEVVERVFGKESASLVQGFKRMRRKRHPLQYEAKFLISKKEIEDAIKRANLLTKKIEDHIGIAPEKRLF